jgi:hypothetical protein
MASVVALTPRRVALRGFAATAVVPAAVLAGAVGTLRPELALAACLGLAVVVAVALHPPAGAYLLIGVTPLVAGVNRGGVLPLVRPGEALALLVAAGLCVRAAAEWRTGTTFRPHLSRIEWALLLMAVANSVVPVVWMLARGHPISHDDVLYALVLWKFLAIYVLVRLCVRTDRQVLTALWLSVAAASVVAVVAILQSLALFGIPRLLATYYAPYGYTNLLDNSRGSSTLGIPAATADLMIYNLAIAAGLWRRSPALRPLLAGMAVLFVGGALSAGEFSSALGLAVGVVCVALVLREPRVLGWFVPAAVIGYVALRPVIERRLSGFQSASGLPVSWTGRLDNLRAYFWPRLFSDENFLFGVQPAARVPVPTQGTGYVWIESGYTWLLWGGGIPLLLAFGYFCYAAIRTSYRAARERRGTRSIVGTAVFVAVVVMSVLMIFDPHLTYRGAAEEMFALLALLAVTGAPTSAPSPADARNRALQEA